MEDLSRVVISDPTIAFSYIFIYYDKINLFGTGQKKFVNV